MSLGGKTTTTGGTTIDPALKAAALENLAMAKKIGQLGYVPYTGDTVAGMQPGQISAIQSGNLGANAFGLPEMAVPTGQNLNPYAAYTDALANIPAGQRAFIESMFINPQTGAAPTMDYGTGNATGNKLGTRTSFLDPFTRLFTQTPQETLQMLMGGHGNGGSGANNRSSIYTPSGYYDRGTGGGGADNGQAANSWGHGAVDTVSSWFK